MCTPRVHSFPFQLQAARVEKKSYIQEEQKEECNAVIQKHPAGQWYYIFLELSVDYNAQNSWWYPVNALKRNALKWQKVLFK